MALLKEDGSLDVERINKLPIEEWPDEVFLPWFNRGWELAKQIRQRLPMEVDLFYHWKPFALENASFSIDIPFIVPDGRLLVERRTENPAI